MIRASFDAKQLYVWLFHVVPSGPNNLPLSSLSSDISRFAPIHSFHVHSHPERSSGPHGFFNVTCCVFSMLTMLRIELVFLWRLPLVKVRGEGREKAGVAHVIWHAPGNPGSLTYILGGDR